MKERIKWSVRIAVFSLALTLAGGNFAFAASSGDQLDVEQRFRTAFYHTELTEVFESPENWKPGMETEKKVRAVNQSSIPVLARIEMDQKWVRTQDVYANVSSDDGPRRERIPPYAGDSYPLAIHTSEGEEYAALLRFNRESVVALESGRAWEKGLRLNLESVSCVEEARGKWLLVSEEPKQEGNYVFYYIGQIEPGKQTPYLLESVTMNPSVENSVKKSTLTWVRKTGTENGYAQERRDVLLNNGNPNYGYDSAQFTLHLKLDTVQAMNSAVVQVWRQSAEQEEEKRIADYLASQIVHGDIYENANENQGTKQLYLFSDKNGVLHYDPRRMNDGGQEENLFLKFGNLQPGAQYQDSLEIENRGDRSYSLYLQLMPDHGGFQEEEQKLLKEIWMELYSVREDGTKTLYYKGTVRGEETGGLETARIPLGTYAKGETGKLEVHLTLNPQLSWNQVEAEGYQMLWAQASWRFFTSWNGEAGGSGSGGHSSGGHSSGDRDAAVFVDGQDAGESQTGGETLPEMPYVEVTPLPKTGDFRSDSRTAAAVFALSLLGCVIVIGKRRKEKHETKAKSNTRGNGD